MFLAFLTRCLRALGAALLGALFATNMTLAGGAPRHRQLVATLPIAALDQSHTFATRVLAQEERRSATEAKHTRKMRWLITTLRGARLELKPAVLNLRRDLIGWDQHRKVHVWYVEALHLTRDPSQSSDWVWLTLLTSSLYPLRRTLTDICQPPGFRVYESLA